jgi:hypothetical protein
MKTFSSDTKILLVGIESKIMPCDPMLLGALLRVLQAPLESGGYPIKRGPANETTGDGQ